MKSLRLGEACSLAPDSGNRALQSHTAPRDPHNSKPSHSGFLNLSTTDTLESDILYWGPSWALRDVRHPSPPHLPDASGTPIPSCDNQKCLQILPNVPWGQMAPVGLIDIWCALHTLRLHVYTSPASVYSCPISRFCLLIKHLCATSPALLPSREGARLKALERGSWVLCGLWV